MDILGMKL